MVASADRQTPPKVSRFDFIRHNFSGQGDGERIYGVTGIDAPWVFDGKTLQYIQAPLTGTGVHPGYIAAYKNHLILGYEEGSLFLSLIHI